MSLYDLIVIGGGSGGLAAARRAANKYGQRVALIEGSRLGGTCVNRGCVPKKVMYNAASLADTISIAGDYGFRVEGGKAFDWDKLCRGRDAYIRRLNEIFSQNLEKDNVTVLRGWGRVEGTDGNLKKVSIDGKQIISAPRVILAVGDRPVRLLKIPGQELGITSDEFFLLKEQPKKVGIIGSGYIGVELAGVLHSLGTQVTLWCRKEGVLSHFDTMLSQTCTEQMKKSGIEVREMSNVKGISRGEVADDALQVCFEQYGKMAPDCHGYDQLIWAVGRQPNTDNLLSEEIDCERNQLGHLIVDEYQNTKVPGVYALGDITGKAPLTPVAISTARKLTDRLFGGMAESRQCFDNVPTVVFSHPSPCASVGLSEAEARQRFGEDHVKVYSSTFTNMFYALSSPDRKCITKHKLVCVGAEEKIVGLHMIGAGSDEILQGFSVAIIMGACKKDFDACVAIHPTASEELVTMAP